MGKQKMLMALIAALSVSACDCATPNAGFEDVLVMKPMIFGHGGVDPDPVRTGRTFIAWTTSAVPVDMRPQLFKVHLDDFFTSDGVPLDFDATMRLRITSSVRIVSEFGLDWYANNIQPEFTRAVRDAVKKHGMNEAALNVSAAADMDREITEVMRQYIASTKLPVELMEVTLGRANPPDAVKTQRVETATQEQRQNTEQQRKKAEDERREAELSRAKADNAYREGMSLSPTQFIALEQIKMLHEVCGAPGKDRAGGAFLVGGAGGIMPTLEVGGGAPAKK